MHGHLGRRRGSAVTDGTSLHSQEDRARRLAEEKSYLQLVNDLMSGMTEMPGLQNTLAGMAKLLLDSIGGNDVSVYCWAGGQLHYADAFGASGTLESIDDPIVAAVFESYRLGEDAGDSATALVDPPALAEATSWAIPLQVGSTLVGVLRMDGMLIAEKEMRARFRPFFHYAALVLKNEVDAFELQQSNEELKRSQATLETLSAGLGVRVAERGSELRAANEKLQHELAERERARQALEFQFATLRGIIDSSDALILSVDEEHRYTSFNRNHAQGMHALYGADIELGHSMLEYMSVPKDREVARANLDRALAGERHHEEVLIGEDPSNLRFLSVSHSPIRSQTGEVIGVAMVAQDLTDYRLAEQELRDAEAKFSAAFSASPDSIAVTRASDGTIMEVNESYTRMLGYTREESLGKTTAELALWADPADRAAFVAAINEFGEVKDQEVTFVRKDGTRVTVLDSARTIDFGGEQSVLAISHDITSRKEAEEALSGLNRELRAVSNCNQTLLRAEDEQTLLRDICAIICDDAGYRMAWVGYAQDDEGKSVRPMAWAGADEGLLAAMDIRWDNTMLGHGPTGRAISQGETTYVQDFETDPRVAPWRNAALDRKFRSCASLPLRDAQSRTFGALVVYSGESDAFTPDELRLLEELAGDLAFGVTALRSREALELAEQERESHLRFLENMDRVNQALQRSGDFEQTMSDLLDSLLSIFGCDRAFLVYPCDPDAPSWRSVMERTQPEYPGIAEQGLEIPSDDGVRSIFTLLRESSVPVAFGPGLDAPQPRNLVKQFGIQTQVAMAVYPKNDSPYMFGLHQCSYERAWNDEEKALFQEIGRRLTDALTSVLAHRSLRESEAKYRRIVDTASEGIWVLGPDATTTFVNATTAQMIGYTEEELLSTRVTDFMPEEDVSDHLKRLERRRQGVSESYERRFRHKDGHLVWIRLSAAPIFDDDGSFVGSFGMLTDITEEKQAQEAVHEAARYVRRLIEAALDPFVTIGPDGTITDVNRAMEQAAGVVRDRLIGTDFASYFTDPVDASIGYRRVLEEGLVRDYPLTLRSVSGETVDVLYNATTYVNEAGELQGVFAVARDITALEQAEAEIHRVLVEMVEAISLTIEKRDPYTSGHQKGVAELASAIAEQMGLEPLVVEGVHLGGMMHDIGKIYVPAEILSRPGKLSPSEWQIIQTHPSVGAEILHGVHAPWPIEEMVLQHHERLDGSGYPQGLKDDEILTESRILAVADVVEAMASHRPYRPALGVARALEEITNGSGTLYDEHVVLACTELFEEKGFAFEA
jgi:PAS domain S-box-containing protein/putative nucleotidyltransferase with HDIG domain